MAYEVLSEVQKVVQDVQVPQIARPASLRAGFAAQVDDLDGSGLLHAGEQWAPRRFMIAEHAHPTWEFYLQLHGLTRWRADRQLWTVRPGDLLGVPPGMVHCMAEESAASIHFMYAALDPLRSRTRLAGLDDAWSGPTGLIHLPGASRLVDPFAQLIDEVTTGQEFSGAGLTLAVDRIALELTRMLRPTRRSRALAIHPAVQQTQMILDRDFDRSWPLKELADRVALAPNYLAGLFSAEFGRGPHEYQTERRIARAKQLLATSDLTVTAIALEVGFSSGQHLSRTFRQLTGVTPSAYRRDEGARRVREPTRRAPEWSVIKRS